MTEVMGIQFAPLRIPLNRRLQTFAVFQQIMGIFVYPIMSLIVVVTLLFSPLFWIALLYLSWLYFYDIKRSKMGGRRFQFIRKLKLWDHYRDYFPVSLIKTADLDPKQNYLIGYHPHGIISCGVWSNFCTEATGFTEKYPGITPYPLTLETNFYWPILRGYLLAMGLCDVSKESINYLLKKSGPGTAAIVVVGGAEEALEAHPGSYKLKLKDRKGFVAMAIKNGAQLVPCFSFGENELFKQANNPRGSLIRRFQDKVKSILKISPPIFYGRGVFNYSLGLMPFRTPINTVVGAPIKVTKNDSPSQEEVAVIHQQYLEALSDLFDAHKVKYGLSDEKKLEFY